MLVHPSIDFAINLDAANEFKEGKYFDHARKIMQKTQVEEKSS